MPEIPVIRSTLLAGAVMMYILYIGLVSNWRQRVLSSLPNKVKIIPSFILGLLSV